MFNAWFSSLLFGLICTARHWGKLSSVSCNCLKSAILRNDYRRRKSEKRFQNECSVQLKEKITWLTVSTKIHKICREVPSSQNHAFLG